MQKNYIYRGGLLLSRITGTGPRYLSEYEDGTCLIIFFMRKQKLWPDFNPVRVFSFCLSYHIPTAEVHLLHQIFGRICVLPLV